MGRRKKPPIPIEGLSMEVVKWDDPYTKTRCKMSDENDDPSYNLTIGFVTRESEKYLWLAHEVSGVDEEDDDEVLYDFTRIRKELIDERRPFEKYKHEEKKP